MIVADTGAIVALIGADDRHHAKLRRLYEADPDSWVLPWAILPEVDYLASSHIGTRAQEAFFEDLTSGAFFVAWGDDDELKRAQRLCTRYSSLKLGLVDAVVMTLAERSKAEAIATLDLRHFAAVSIRGAPRLYPRDLP